TAQLNRMRKKSSERGKSTSGAKALTYFEWLGGTSKLVPSPLHSLGSFPQALKRCSTRKSAARNPGPRTRVSALQEKSSDYSASFGRSAVLTEVPTAPDLRNRKAPVAGTI